jgi:ABC-type branched-subunit amino acid transport system ATPase component
VAVPKRGLQLLKVGHHRRRACRTTISDSSRSLATELKVLLIDEPVAGMKR